MKKLFLLFLLPIVLQGFSQGKTPRKRSAVTVTSLDDYIYRPPSGWTTKRFSDGIVLSSPVSNTGENCNITLWPMRKPSTDLQNDAASLFRDVFKTYESRQSSTPGSMIRGVSPAGWEYYIIKNSFGVRGTDYPVLFGFSFVARIGNRLAAITGISKDPLVSSCFGLNLTNVWPEFFYQLGFRNTTIPAIDTDSIHRQLTGVWMSVTGSSGDRYVFSSNGRFANAAAAQRYVRVSYTELLRITDASFGNGNYELNGNGITLKEDETPASLRTGYYRIEKENILGKPGWKDKLYLQFKSSVDGAIYEICYDRQ